MHKSETFLIGLIFAIAGGVTISGCSTITSQPLVAKNVPPAKGGYYSLPMTMIKVSRTCESETKCDPVKVETVTVADPQHRYRTDFRLSAAADDKLSVKVNEVGLLEEISSDTTDRTPEIIQTVAATVVTGLTGIPATNLGFQGLSQNHLPFTFLFSPTSLTAARTTLKADFGVNFKLTDMAGGEQVTAAESDDSMCNKIICFRATKPYLATADNQTVIVNLNHQSPIVGINVARRFGVDTVTKITFSDGVPTEISLNKPSEILAAVAIPFKISQAIVKIPAELVQLRINRTDASQKLLDSQKAVLQSQQNIEDQMRTLNASRTGPNLQDLQRKSDVLTKDKELLDAKSASAKAKADLIAAQNALADLCAKQPKGKPPTDCANQ